MHWRLGKGKAIRKMELKWSRFSVCPWPSQVCELAGLESFSLLYARKTLDRELLALHLSTISRNLKKLELESISFRGVRDALFLARKPI